MSSIALSASVSQDGWLSDDEPPQDRLGDLHPLQLDRSGRLVTFKQIIKLGTIIPTAFGSLDSVTVKYANTTQSPTSECAHPTATNESYFRKWTDLLPPVEECTSFGDFKQLCPIGSEALRYMRIGEICIVWTSTDREGIDSSDMILDKKLSALLQSKRRKFARANAEGKAWGLIKRTKQQHYYSSLVIQLVNLTPRQGLGKFVKTIRKPSASWQTPSETATITLKITDESLNSEPQSRQLRICDLEGSHWQDLLRSVRLGEQSQIEFKAGIADKEDLLFFNSPLLGAKILIELTEIKKIRSFRIPAKGPNAGGIEPVDDLSYSQIEEEEDRVRLESIQTLESADHDEQFRTYGGSDILKTGDLVILALLDRPETVNGVRNIAFHVSRSKAVPEWFHAIVKQCRFGVKYRLSMSKGVHSAVTGNPAVQEQSGSDIEQITENLMKALMVEKSAFYYRKLLGQGDSIAYIPVTECHLYEIQLPDDLSMFEHDGRFSLERVISWESIMRNGELSFIATALCGQEVNAWQSGPATVLAHASRLLAETTRSIQEMEVLARCNSWSIDSITYLKQLRCRALDRDDMQELRSMDEATLDEDTLATDGTCPANESTMEEVVPNRLARLSFVAGYLRASFCYVVQDWRGLLFVVKDHIAFDSNNIMKNLDQWPNLVYSLIGMKARAQFSLKLYDECVKTCSLLSNMGSMELADLGKLAAEKDREQHRKDKELYARMFR